MEDNSHPQYQTLSVGELQRILEINEDVRKRENNTRTLFASTLGGAFLGTVLVNSIAVSMGPEYREVVNYMNNEGFTYFITPTALACVAKVTRDLTGWRGKQSREYHTAKNVLTEKKELKRLKETYEPIPQ